MISSIISRLVILVFGTLYPAYASYKAVRTKNLKEYVKWMMYWIVFALFTCTETFTDVFFSWFPFYYEVKIVLVLWLLSPATKGSSILYRKFVHPALCRREQEIDEYIAKAKDQGYHTVLNLGTKGVNYATTVIMQTAIKGGGGLVQQLRKSYSLSDLSECEPREERGADEADDVLAEPRLIRRAVKSHIKSTEDISSGYSSAENSASLTRTASVGASRSRARTTRTTVTTIKRPQAAEDDHVIIEEPHDDDSFDYTNMPPLVNFPSPLLLSNTDPPFIYQYVGKQIKIIKLLDNYPLNTEINSQNDNTDNRHQNEASEENRSFSLKESSVNIPCNIPKTEDSLKDCTHIPDAIQSHDNNDKHVCEPKITATLIDQQITGFELSFKSEIKPMSIDIKDSLQSNLIDNNVPGEFIDAISSNDNKLQVNLNDNLNIQSSDFIPAIIEDNLESIYELSEENNYDSAESDDEGSFGTPVSSPKSSRKTIKGKYGKNKAPPPPKLETQPQESSNDKILCLDTSHTLVVINDNQIQNMNEKHETDIEAGNSVVQHVNITNEIPNIIKTEKHETDVEAVTSIIQDHINNDLPEICLQQNEKKNLKSVSEKDTTRKSPSPEITKSKSPVKDLKGSAFGKLLQIPSKLAFWNKTDDKSTTDNMSTTSETSRKSSQENIFDDFQSCSNLNLSISSNEEPMQTAEVSNNEITTYGDNLPNDISLKSDALQKVIDAKLEEMNPEIKFVSLHEIPTTSKSTDV
ncbi:uncharacterized protein LOC112051326 isoform X2 [Bicyclus anynana]|uniref:Uncharacterized protein LOC112051326 isoform X2 n=1 Tax=Bicyclus anynana TaxID=110368 RepID=A0A6J1ND44_BICAN|nr:uncharacterized protein LOC112051326 isoform X2 [Bicyclus anynana]